MSEAKQYDERDVWGLDVAGGYYTRHVFAMTAEQLISKSAIAAELAVRDRQIDALAADNQRLREAIESAESLFPLIIDAQKFWFDGREIKADGDDRFYSAKKVDDFLSGIHAALAGSKGDDL